MSIKTNNDNIILFGGTFDPIHNGHIRLAKAASRILCGKIYFIPAKSPRWKHPKASPIHRENMIKSALLSISDPNLLYSDVELKRQGDTTYTIDTVKEFSQKFPKSKLILLIGGDSVNSFDRWKDAEKISSLCQIVYIDRDDILVNEDIINKFNMERLSYSGAGPVSSSGIRDLRTADTPECVLEYIERNNLYYINEVREYMSPKRFAHSLSVAHLAHKIAKSNQFMNPDAAYIAGLLHDIGKNIPEEQSRALVFDHDPEFANYPSYCLHQFVGEYLAIERFGIENQHILDAIKYHCTGKPHMSPLGKIIYASDKIEPTRGYDSSKLIQHCLSNYSSGFLEVLRENRSFISSKGNSDDENELSKLCYKLYLR